MRNRFSKGKCQQRGAATSAAKFNGLRVGVRQKRIAPGEVSDGRLFADIDRGWRHFWHKRVMKGIFPSDTRALKLSATSAA